MSDRRLSDRRATDQPPPDGVEHRQIERRRGRPSLPDSRRHRLRIACNSEELVKFRLISRLNNDLKIATMARDMILDEMNAFLADCPRHELVEALRAMGVSEDDITALLKSL